MKRSRRVWTLLGLLSLLFATRGWTESLTTEQVACNATQLDRMLSRMTAPTRVFHPIELPKTVFLTYSNSVGFYEGLALTNQFLRSRTTVGEVPRPEHHLAFHLNPDVRTLLLNPERPPVGQVSLNREQSASNVTSPGAPVEVVLTLDPSLAGNPAPDLLVINNFEVPADGQPYNGFLANSTKPGRGLSVDGLLSACHTRFSEQDRRIFALLQRIVRFRGELNGALQDTLADVEVAVFRAEDERTYRLNATFLDPQAVAHGHLTLELRIESAEDGRLTVGTLTALPACTGASSLACTTTDLKVVTVLVAPVLPGQDFWNDQGPEARRLFFDPTQPLPSPVAVDFEALLAGTTWNFPVP